MKGSLALALLVLPLGSTNGLASNAKQYPGFPKDTESLYRENQRASEKATNGFLKEQIHAAKANEQHAEQMHGFAENLEKQYKKGQEEVEKANRNSKLASDRAALNAEKVAKGQLKDMQMQYQKGVQNNLAAQKEQQRVFERDTQNQEKVKREQEEHSKAEQLQAMRKQELDKRQDTRKSKEHAQNLVKEAQEAQRSVEAAQKAAIDDDEKNKKEARKVMELNKENKAKIDKENEKAMAKSLSNLTAAVNKAAKDFHKGYDMSKKQAFQDFKKQFGDHHMAQKKSKEAAHHKAMQNLDARKQAHSTFLPALAKGHNRVAKHLAETAGIAHKHHMDMRKKLAHDHVQSHEHANKQITGHALLKAQEKAIKAAYTPEVLMAARKANQEIAAEHRAAQKLMSKVADHKTAEKSPSAMNTRLPANTLIKQIEHSQRK